jgi:hypothetical protein
MTSRLNAPILFGLVGMIAVGYILLALGTLP